MRREAKHRQDIYQKTPLIPTPPTKYEYYQYLGKQPLRIFSVVLFFLSLGSIYGIWAVFTKSYFWYAGLLMLVVMVPWSIYIVVLATFRPRITWESHRQVIRAGKHMLRSSVDVFLPVCGEDLEIIRNTLHHVYRMTWDGPLNVYVLDDGDSWQVSLLAREFGANYLVRDDRPLFKKSGNMNNGMRHSSGQFIVVFDADFAPAPDFLLETIPYFLYRNVGIVQTSQYFDVRRSETRNWIQQLSGSIQDMFFCWAQPARNTADSAMCVGTNVVYRRAALEASGGFPEVEGGEDVVTGLEVYSEGYRTIYLPLNLAKGVCPDTFGTAINQQYRWARSSLQMFVGDNPYRRALKRAPLSLRQKIVYWSGALYYAQSVLVLLLAVLPSMAMLWNFPWMVGPGNYLPIAPAMLGMFALPMIIRGWRPTILRLVLVYSVAHTIAVVDVLRGTMAAWTPSGNRVKSNTLARRAGILLRTWVVVTQLLSWIPIAIDLPTYGWPAYWPAVVLSAFQTIVLFPLLLPGYGIKAQFTLIPYLFRRNLWYRRARKHYKYSRLSPRH